MQIAELYQIFQAYPIVSTDTRQIKPNCIFFALTGESFNGNSFAATALGQGAEYVVIDQEEFYRNEPGYVLVDNVLETLQDLATYHRKQLEIPVIGITGTNGKTTSKELLFSVLSQSFKTSCTQGNLNNHIGVPLTILAIDKSIEIAIVEMGANHVHEIASLCEIAQPTHGLITNVGKAHLEGFGSFEGVMKAKGELYDYLRDHQGQIFIQGDNPHLATMANQRKIEQLITYGFSDSNSVSGSLLQANPFLSFCWKQTDQSARYEVQTQLTGTYNLENILAAISVGLQFNLKADQINTGLTRYSPKNNRSQITKTAKNTVIADFYNANSSSMQA
ncbi:MAG: UDP-N-acetylmuramoyl-tripeptide--D-alanyl-D-alanine ligase, partial [Sphingobacterium sp.]